MAVLMVLLLSACTTWGATTSSTAQLRPLEGQRAGRMLLRLTDGTTKELWNAQIGADSVIGFRPYSDGTRERVAIARSELRDITLRRLDVGKTFAWLAGGTVAVVLLFRVVVADLFSGST